MGCRTAASWDDGQSGRDAYTNAVTQSLMDSLIEGNFLSKLTTASRAELMLKGMEDELGRFHESVRLLT